MALCIFANLRKLKAQIEREVRSLATDQLAGVLPVAGRTLAGETTPAFRKFKGFLGLALYAGSYLLIYLLIEVCAAPGVLFPGRRAACHESWHHVTACHVAHDE